MRESYLFVVYDIEDDRIRNKVYETCKDYGLKPVQYSVFWGKLSQNLREELFLRIQKTLGDKPGYVLVLPMCESDFRKVLRTGEPLSPYQEPVVVFV